MHANGQLRLEAINGLRNIDHHPTLQLVNSIGVEVRSKGQCLGGDGVFTKLVRHSFPTKCILLETISHKFNQIIIRKPG